MADLPDPWIAYARLQSQLARTRHIDGYSWGLEAALNQAVAGASADADNLDRTVRSEARNERRRAVLRLIYLPSDGVPRNPSPEDALDAGRLLHAVRLRLTPAQWRLLRAVGEGHEYKDIAAVANVAPGALRARVLRLRRTLVVALSVERAGPGPGSESTKLPLAS
jgi:DNA-binding NarL/FixJ family response regulator